MEDFKRCGDITTTVRIGRKYFAFNCIYCNTVYLQFEEFAAHIEESHYDVLYGCDGSESLLDELDSDVLEKMDPLEEELICLDEEHIPQCIVEDISCDPSNLKHSKADNTSVVDTIIEFENNSDDDRRNTNNTNIEIAKNCKSQEADYEEVFLFLMEEYKKNSVFWDSNIEDAKYQKKREKALKGIVQAIQKNFNIVLSDKAVNREINRIERKSYKQEKKMRSFKAAPLYHKLAFFEETLPSSKHLEKSTRDSTLPLPNLSDEENLQFIEIYQTFSCLWNIHDVDFHVNKKRIKAVEEMIRTIANSMELKLTQNELLNKIYQLHLACTKEKGRQLDCRRSGEEFRPLCRYFEELSFLIDNVGPFKCDFCDETFDRHEHYRMHKSQHDGSKPFVCPVCNRGISQLGNFNVHMRRHTREYPFECSICKKRFPTTTDMHVHKRCHTGEKPYFCDICGQSFRTVGYFKAHLRRHKNVRTFACDVCSKTFFENENLKQHMKIHLNVRDSVCNVCGKAFISAKYLRQHKLIHAEKKRYVCKICEKAFAQYAGLSGHMRSHGTTVTGVINSEASVESLSSEWMALNSDTGKSFG